MKAATKKGQKGTSNEIEVSKRIRGLKKQLSTELDTISNMTYNQMKREKRDRVRKGTIKVAAGLGAVSSASSGLSLLGSVPLMMLYGGNVAGAITALSGAVSTAVSVPLGITAMPENTTRNGQKWVDEYFKVSGVSSYSDLPDKNVKRK